MARDPVEQYEGELLAALDPVAGLSECNGHYTWLLARACMATGKAAKDLTLGELGEIEANTRAAYNARHYCTG